MKIVTLTMVSLKIAKSVSMPKEVMVLAMVILVDLLLNGVHVGLTSFGSSRGCESGAPD